MDSPQQLAVDAPRVWDRPAVTVPAMAVLALIGGRLPSFSTAANVYVIVIGGALLWLGLGNRVPRRAAGGRLRTPALWWLVPALLFGVLEAATFIFGTKDGFPTFSRLSDPLLEDPMIRSAAYFGWLAAFWGMVRR
ncbi:hypothetical protein ACK8GE_03215 [Micromonosporaceae bacterium DT194]|uniref:hypothetical protein n=1 Tax=Melissospora conviva TaxID=3388432 RepID=UPI003C23DC53